MGLVHFAPQGPLQPGNPAPRVQPVVFGPHRRPDSIGSLVRCSRDCALVHQSVEDRAEEVPQDPQVQAMHHVLADGEQVDAEAEIPEWVFAGHWLRWPADGVDPFCIGGQVQEGRAMAWPGPCTPAAWAIAAGGQ
eukprot:7646380-Alexandrium_andersonii.AAC.1